MRISDATREAIAIHQAAGRSFTAAGVRSFARDEGRGSPVVMLHGAPSSSFLYRKMVPLVAGQGLRAIAFDYPGLGLADRPENFDYSWSGLARWTGDALEALEVDRAHLVVHDIAGPIGYEWAIRNPERVLSVTVLNTWLNVATFRRPWTMHPLSIRGIGELWLWGTPRFAFIQLFYLQGVADRSALSRDEVDAYRVLLRRSDAGRAFLRVIRGFELTAEKQRFLWEGIARNEWPTRIVWGERDPVLGLDKLAVVREVTGAAEPLLLPAKHFLQEDRAQELAHAVSDLAAPLG
jgi:pimeloyl-ACP methyl ester carboxylesterase